MSSHKTDPQAYWTEWSAWVWSQQYSQYYRQRQNTLGEIQTQYGSEVQNAAALPNPSSPRRSNVPSAAEVTTGPLGFESSQNQVEFDRGGDEHYSQYAPQRDAGATDLYHQLGSEDTPSSLAPAYTHRQSYHYSTNAGTYGNALEAVDRTQSSEYGQSTNVEYVPQGFGNDRVVVARAQSVLNTGSDKDPVEKLDPSYKRLDSKSRRSFFVNGRVLSMLWTEPSIAVDEPTSASAKGFRKAYTIVQFGESTFTEIRRFIIVQNQGTHHSICVPITSYGGRAAVHRCDAAHHAIAYMGASPPAQYPGEQLNRHPIKIEPRGNGSLHDASRINFSKVYTIEHNVKVKNLGKVSEAYLSWVRRYWEESMCFNPGQ